MDTVMDIMSNHETTCTPGYNPEGSRLTVIGEPFLLPTSSRRRSYVVCQCECGVVGVYQCNGIKTGNTTSCGCLRATHGLWLHPLYRTWAGMKGRCGNPNAPAFEHYGGRGISVCDRWRESFPAFLEDMGERPDGHTLDRIDNDGDYCPENCRWATHESQHNNTRQNVRIFAFGETKTVSEWARDHRCSCPQACLRNRVRVGWDYEEAITTPSLRPKK